MALRPIITLPDPKLRLVSRKIERIDDSLRRLIDDMIETMHEAPGVGLAAIQVGEPIRLLVVDVAKKEEPPQPQVFVNPEIVWSSEERATYEEGCLSIPEYYAEVERPASVRARALDRDGELREMVAEGLLATVLQHEIDHLDGVLVHRPHLEAQARPGDQEVPESRQTRRRRPARAVAAAVPPDDRRRAARQAISVLNSKHFLWHVSACDFRWRQTPGRTGRKR